MREINRSELVRYDFTAEEISARARELAAANQEVDQLESEKKQVATDYKGKIEARQSAILSLSRSISTGFEMRRCDCVWSYNSPEVGLKTLSVKDTGVYVRQEPMTAEEKQEELPLEPAAAAEPEVIEAEPVEVATLHGEAVLDSKAFTFTGRRMDVTLAAAQRRDGWFWKYIVNGDGQTMQNDSLDAKIALYAEATQALAAGAQVLHDVVLLALRRNNSKLSQDHKDDARYCMEWAIGIMSNPANAADRTINRPAIEAPERDRKRKTGSDHNKSGKRSASAAND